MTTLARLAAVAFAALAMLALLLGLAAAGLGRPDRTAAYVAAAVVCAVIVGILMRRDVRRRRAAEALLPPERRPRRRVPRSPIAFPLRETLIGFALWYAVAVAVDRAVTGTTTVFTLVAVAPFAAFMLTALTVAGRHMAFRITAEEASESDRPD
ncbi:MAG: hypothetical protein ACRDGT_10825 [Candidatus Limnocylindria bacterium]